MRSDLETLRERVVKATGAARGVEIEDVRLEPGYDNEGDEFLRVMVQVKNLDRAANEDLLALIKVIEDAVEDIDERYPSVRFPDAA